MSADSTWIIDQVCLIWFSKLFTWIAHTNVTQKIICRKMFLCTYQHCHCLILALIIILIYHGVVFWSFFFYWPMAKQFIEFYSICIWFSESSQYIVLVFLPVLTICIVVSPDAKLKWIRYLTFGNLRKWNHYTAILYYYAIRIMVFFIGVPEQLVKCLL